MAAHSVKDVFDSALVQYEDTPSELQGVLAYSGTGRLYVATDDGKLRSADVRQQLLAGEWAENREAGGDKKPPAVVVRTIYPSPPLELNASQFALNRSGTYAALAGPSAEDPEFSGVAVVDLSSCRPSREGDHDIAASLAVDPTLFESRAGLRVLQVAWHPDSDCHLAVLTSDATWRLYNTQRPDLPEQTFELQLRGSRRLGLEGDGAPSQLPVAFAFGGGEGWDRLAVYFCTAASQLHTLCPVVPFGCRYSARLIEGLREEAELASSGGEVEHAPTSLAWLGRAFQPVPPGLSGGPGGSASPGGGLLFSVPTALEEHCPSLAGPLPVESAGGGGVSLTALAGRRRDAAQAMLMARYGSDCTALAVGTAAGVLGLYLLAGEGAAPRWAESTPQCISEGVHLQAVRSQVPTAPGDSPSFLLLDAVRLGLGGGSGQQEDDEEEDDYGEGSMTNGAAVRLCADPAVAERLYCVNTAGAYAVTISWLPLLSDFLAAAAGEGPAAALPAALPAPAVEELLASKPGVVDGVAVGDALSGSALIVLEADGAPRCLRARVGAGAAAAAEEEEPRVAPLAAGAGSGTPAAGSSAAASAAAVEKDVEAHVARVYGDLLAGPSGAALPAAAPGPRGAGNPAGQRHLSATAAALRARDVEFAHKAHHDLMQRLSQIRTELERQEAKRAAQGELAAAAAQGADSLDARLERVAQFQGNLTARLALLGELHWSLPRPPSEAERALKGRELPEWEAASKQLEGDIRSLHGRVDALQRKARSMGQVAAAHATLNVQVPPPQLRRMREALAAQEAQIEANLALLEALEAAAAEQGAGL